MRRESDDSSSFGAGEMANYRELLIKDRNSRTLTMRRSNRPTLAGLRTGSKRVSILDQFSNFSVTPEQTIEVLNSQSLQRITDFCQALITASKGATAQCLTPVLTSPRVGDAFLECLKSGTLDEECVLVLLRTIACLFPILSTEVQNSFVDDGLIEYVSNFMGSKSMPLVIEALGVLAVASSVSYWARNTILSWGLHEQIVALAHSTEPSVCIASCQALMAIFSSQVRSGDEEEDEEIDLEKLCRAVTMMAELLNHPCVECVVLTLSIFTEIISHNASVLADVHDIGLYTNILRLLQVPDLVDPTLLLLSKMASGGHSGIPANIKEMFDAGLFGFLMTLLESADHVTNVFRVLSSMIEAVPSIVLDHITADFIAGVIRVSKEAVFEVKSEGAFLLSALIKNVTVSALSGFVCEDVVAILNEMLVSGQALIATRSIEAFHRLARELADQSARQSFFAIAREEGVFDSLQNLTEHEDVTGTIYDRMAVSIIEMCE